MLNALSAWRRNTDGLSGGNPRAKVFPKLIRGTSGSRWISRGKWGEESCGQEAHCTRGRTEPFPASCSQVERSEGVCFCPPGGEGRLSGDISSWSHTRLSAADFSPSTTARSCEADWASFPTSVAGAIVGALLGCAFVICFSFHLLSAPLSICVFNWGEKERSDDEKKTAERRYAAWIVLDGCFWRCSLYLSSSSLCALPDDFSSTGV